MICPHNLIRARFATAYCQHPAHLIKRLIITDSNKKKHGSLKDIGIVRMRPQQDWKITFLDLPLAYDLKFWPTFLGKRQLISTLSADTFCPTFEWLIFKEPKGSYSGLSVVVV